MWCLSTYNWALVTGQNFQQSARFYGPQVDFKYILSARGHKFTATVYTNAGKLYWSRRCKCFKVPIPNKNQVIQ